MEHTTTKVAVVPAAADRLVRRDLLILRIEADRRRRSRVPRARQPLTRSTR